MTRNEQSFFNFDTPIMNFFLQNFDREIDSFNWYAYVGNDPINYIDPYGLWKFKGDGTAEAEPGDTLSGLAAQVSGAGSNWTKTTGLTGAPETLQIGQSIDYVGMTTVVNLNANIVQGSGITEAQVQQQIADATIINNSQGVPITFNTSINQISNTSSTGVNLSSIPIGTANQNMAFAAGVGQGVLSNGNGNVPLVTMPGDAITLIYTQTINDGNPRTTTNGVAFDGTATAILSSTMGYGTTGHEIDHLLGLDHVMSGNNVQSPSNNLMGYGRTDTLLTSSQVATLNQNLSNWGSSSSLSLGNSNPENSINSNCE